MNPWTRRVVPLALALAASCSEARPPPDAPVTASVTLGTGQLAWEDLGPEGTHVELIHGPQGGYHVFGRVRFDGLGPDVQLRFRVTAVDGGAPLNNPDDRVGLHEGRGLARTASGWETSNAQLMVLVNVHDPATVVGHRFRLEVTVHADASGAEASDAREVVIVDKT